MHNATSAGPWRCNLVGAVHSLCAQQYQSHFIKLIDRLVVGYESILCQKCSNKYKHSPTCSSRHTFNATFRTFFPPDLKKKKKRTKENTLSTWFGTELSFIRHLSAAVNQTDWRIVPDWGRAARLTTLFTTIPVLSPHSRVVVER